MAENKPVKIEFAPGCFDDFEGTQEELDSLIAEVTNMFANMSPEELEAQSREVDFDELVEEDPEFAAALLDKLSVADRINKGKNAKGNAIHDAVYNTKRKLH